MEDCCRRERPIKLVTSCSIARGNILDHESLLHVCIGRLRITEASRADLGHDLFDYRVDAYSEESMLPSYFPTQPMLPKANPCTMRTQLKYKPQMV
jgi:hypothetical protein